MFKAILCLLVVMSVFAPFGYADAAKAECLQGAGNHEETDLDMIVGFGLLEEGTPFQFQFTSPTGDMNFTVYLDDTPIYTVQESFAYGNEPVVINYSGTIPTTGEYMVGINVRSNNTNIHYTWEWSVGKCKGK